MRNRILATFAALSMVLAIRADLLTFLSGGVEPASSGIDTTGLVFWHDTVGNLTNQHNPGTHDGVPQNSPSYVTGPFGGGSGAIRSVQSGNVSYYVPDHAALTPANDFSFLTWVDLNGSNGSEYLAGQWGSGSARAWIIWWASGHQLKVSLYDTAAEDEITVSTAFDDALGFFHLAIVFDESANAVDVYRNGAYVETLTYTTVTGVINNSASNLYVGAIGASNTTNADWARTSFWTRALTADEISRIYNGGADTKYADLPSR